jgi:hypothetical protein
LRRVTGVSGRTAIGPAAFTASAAQTATCARAIAFAAAHDGYVQILIGAAALELAEEGHTAGVDSERVRVERKCGGSLGGGAGDGGGGAGRVAAAMVKMMVAAVASMAAEVESSAVCALHHITYVDLVWSRRALMTHDFWLS